MQLKNNLQSFYSSASHTTATNIGPRVATCSLRDLVLGWTTQHSFGRGISKVVYIEYHKFFPSFTNSALFLRPLCFQLNKCIFNRTSCSPPKWEEFLFFAWRLFRRGIGANCGLYVNNLRAQLNLARCHLATDIVLIRGSLLLWVWFNQITGSCRNKHVLLKCIAEFASICSFQVQLRTPVN